LANQQFKEIKMKKLLALLALCVASTAFAGGESKKVCNIDTKTKKEVCKTIKVHKKVEGDKVPDSKKK
jgi:hypothetical protein